ncbi:MAG: radical SAM protein [Pseudomonadota bacterium]
MPSRDDILKRAGPSREKRHWVRLTKTCNNHCVFCLDSECHDGTSLEPEAVLQDVRKGLARGATRLILSGGEPAIHPRFIDILRKSSALGYGWIQAISNGRRFAYQEFARRAVQSGLREVTISMHGHDARSHDAQTMVPGSFDQSVRGIANLQQTGKCHVSVDVVMSRVNAVHLAKIIEKFAGLGVREFDLLAVQPFGRAWKNPRLMLKASDARHIRGAIERARTLGCWVWTNRLRPQYLEGMEELIQDPLKHLDDIGGRKELFARSMRAGSPPDCHGDRCGACVLEDFCTAFFDVLRLLGLFKSGGKRKAGMADVPLRVHAPIAGAERDVLQRLVKKYYGKAGPGILHLVYRRGNGRRTAWSLPGGLKKARINLQVHEPGVRDFPFRPEAVAAAAAEPECMDVLGLLGDRCEKSVIARGHLEASSMPGGVSSIVYIPFEDITVEFEKGPDLKEVSIRMPRMTMINVPQCISATGASWPAWPYICADWFDDDLLPDPLKFARTFIAELNRTKRTKCASCRVNDSCRGIHINYVRRFGYGVLKPLKDAGFKDSRIQGVK